MDYGALLGGASKPPEGDTHDDMMGGDEGDMSDAGASEVSDEELTHAKQFGFSPEQAKHLKRFVQACYDDAEAGEDKSGGSGPPPPPEPAPPAAGE